MGFAVSEEINFVGRLVHGVINKKGANRCQLAPFLDQMIIQRLRVLRNTLHGQLDTTLRINV
jgi:hypothetical protein